MASEIICLDTSILIDYYRKTDKQNSFFFQLTQTYRLYALSVITDYEITVGSNHSQDSFWLSFFDKVTILPFTREANKIAVEIYRQLKSESKLIEIADILIAATALANGLKLATLNKSHFERIDRNELLDRN
jgi:tRNA(fMet)-specific endonuclease VapC